MSVLLECRDLSKEFPIRSGLLARVNDHVHAVNSVSLKIKKGETLGLVGESGCGKSTLGRLLIRLLDPSSGQIFFDQQDISGITGPELRRLRRKMQIIFQDPYTSLNPRMRVKTLIEEPMIVHRLYENAADRLSRTQELISLVGLPKDAIDKYPHEFSGGQRQRIGIARALAADPQFIVCDEAVSALDVSVQAQIVNLLMDLQQKLGLTYLFIAHNLNIVEYISNQVAVMYLGKVIERAEAEELYQKYRHPYTGALLSASPVADPQHKKSRIILSGDVPSPIHLPPGCSFHPRCPQAQAKCREQIPSLQLTGKTEHSVACWHQLVR